MCCVVCAGYFVSDGMLYSCPYSLTSGAVTCQATAGYSIHILSMMILSYFAPVAIFVVRCGDHIRWIWQLYLCQWSGNVCFNQLPGIHKRSHYGDCVFYRVQQSLASNGYLRWIHSSSGRVSLRDYRVCEWRWHQCSIQWPVWHRP